MRLTVPANYDPSILPGLKASGTFEIYGKLPSDVVGGGRPSYMTTPLSKRSLSSYIGEVHKQGMEFNYLLNSACLGNEEWTKKFHKELDKLLHWLTEVKVDTVTVSIPYLAQVIKARFPHFKLKAGIYAQIDTVKRAKYWEDLGADAINLASFSINRDLETLQAIRQAVKTDLVLIANHFCQPNCPYQLHHQNGHAHASHHNPKFLIDYPIIQCQKNRLANPWLFIAAGWIRPEDIKHYEQMGYSTFKLLERNIPSENLLQRVQAYHEGKFEGNLADLLLSWGFKKKAPKYSLVHMARYFRFWKMPPRLAGTSLSFLQDQGMFFPKETNPIVIDTSAIPDNFMEKFRSGSCRDQLCSTCGYCERIAKKAVTISPEFLQNILPVYDKLEQELTGGSAWR